MAGSVKEENHGPVSLGKKARLYLQNKKAKRAGGKKKKKRKKPLQTTNKETDKTPGIIVCLEEGENLGFALAVFLALSPGPILKRPHISEALYPELARWALYMEGADKYIIICGFLLGC
jgi:hypothetical protein